MRTIKTAPKNLKAEEKRWKAFEMRASGHSYRQIAEALGVSKGRAVQYVQEALARFPAEDVETYRRLELERLDHLTRILMPLVEMGDLQAIDRLLRVIDLRMKILGAYKVQVVDVSQPIQLVWPDGKPVA